MVRVSFRSILARVYPPKFPRKLLIGALGAGMLAGCGGGGGFQTQTVRGPGFSFTAPAKWEVVRTGGMISVRDEGALLSVTVIGLRRAYRPVLWPKVVPELDRVAAEFAKRERGRVTASRTIIVHGRRARQYDVDAPGAREQVTFLLVNRREFQLLCTNADTECAAFVESFTLS
jgi:hypothetical protein